MLQQAARESQRGHALTQQRVRLETANLRRQLSWALGTTAGTLRTMHGAVLHELYVRTCLSDELAQVAEALCTTESQLRYHHMILGEEVERAQELGRLALETQEEMHQRAAQEQQRVANAREAELRHALVAAHEQACAKEAELELRVAQQRHELDAQEEERHKMSRAHARAMNDERKLRVQMEEKLGTKLRLMEDRLVQAMTLNLKHRHD